MNDEKTPSGVTCPQGCRAALLPGQVEGRFIARFDAECCADCAFFGGLCRVQERCRVGPTLYVAKRTIKVAHQRQQLHSEDTPVRVVVESTIRSLKQAFPDSKLPVRGLVRSRMMIYPAAMMVNVRRLHRYLATKVEEATQEVASSLSSLKNALCHCLNGIHCRFAPFLPAKDARATAAPLI